MCTMAKKEEAVHQANVSSQTLSVSFIHSLCILEENYTLLLDSIWCLCY